MSAGTLVRRWPLGSDLPRAKYIFSRTEYDHLMKLHQSNPELPVNRGSFVDMCCLSSNTARRGLSKWTIRSSTNSARMWFTPAAGYTAGHVLIHVGYEHGEHAVMTGDVIHHPIQFVDPSLPNAADFDAGLAHQARLGVMSATRTRQRKS